MAQPVIEFAKGEHDYLESRNGRDFFLALTPYVNALNGDPQIREVLSVLEAETQTSLQGFVDEENEMIAEAKSIRVELAERAPEIDNSDMEQPDPASHARARYDLDSFAKFDQLADADNTLAYPVIPQNGGDPGQVSRLLGILRGRLRAAEYGEDTGIKAERIRDDLGDLSRRIGRLGERHRVWAQRYRQESRTLPGVAYARLVYFGSGLVADPVQLATDEDVERFLDRSLREWGQPKTTARKLANEEQLEDWERRSVSETEATLKLEAERLQRELVRRLTYLMQQDEPVSAPSGHGSGILMFARTHAALFIVTVVATVVAGLILYVLIGD